MQTNLFITDEKISFKTHKLDQLHHILYGNLPSSLRQNLDFIHLWNIHPDDFHLITLHNKEVATPRWQQAYGKNYNYAGRTIKAAPIPEMLAPLLHWCQSHIDERLNGLQLSWYDGNLKHYMEKHGDNVENLVADTPIVTISLGVSRTFRFRPHLQQENKFDLDALDGRVFVIPADTRRAFTREVPHLIKNKDRRISITLHALLTE